MRTGEITTEDYRRMYVTCKEPGCVYVSPLESGLELKFETCKKCGCYGVVKAEQIEGMNE